MQSSVKGRSLKILEGLAGWHFPDNILLVIDYSIGICSVFTIFGPKEPNLIISELTFCLYESFEDKCENLQKQWEKTNKIKYSK